MNKTLFLSPPGFDGFDGGAGSRYQARREITSYWYPTWLAQPAALVPNAKLLDCPPHHIDIQQCLATAKDFDQVIIHTSTPSLKNDCRVAEAVKRNRPETKIGFVGAHAVADVYKRDLKIENYFIGYLLHPYLSMYTGRGCPAQCTFCLWPQTIGGHKYRVRSAQNVADEMAYMKKLFPQVKEFFFDDDTFTANLPRAREIAKKLAPLGLTWSCNSRANIEYDTIRFFKDSGLRLFLVGYESGNEDILTRIKKGVSLEEMRRFTKACHRAGVVIHGTFILGLPVETRESIENTIRFAQELDVFSIQVSLAAPYPGTELFEMARQNGWFVKKDKTDLVEEDGFQQSSLEYPGLGKEEIFESVERFYHRYYLRPKPILRIIKTMLEDKDVCVRRLREGYEFFKSMAQRRSDLEAAKSAGGVASSATA